MSQGNARPQELALPVASLAALRRALAETVGDDAAATALQEAGVAAGDAFFKLLVHTSSSAEDPAQWADSQFWRRFAELFERRGWGRIGNEAVHPGVGALDAFDWVESNPELLAGRPACHFTSGLLANLLGRVCQDEVAVLEVECRSRGDSRCRFLYGNPEVLESVYGRLRAGMAVADSLAALA